MADQEPWAEHMRQEWNTDRAEQHRAMERENRKRQWRRARPVFAIAIAIIGAVGFALAVSSDRVDSALFFVLLPTALAMALVFVPGRTGYGQATAGVTIVLLLSAVFLHEGVICVVLAAPLVYAVVFVVIAVVKAVQGNGRRGYALLPIPLLVLTAGLEGVTPELRVDPDQSAAVVRTVALSAAEVEARIATGPRPADLRSVPLRVLGVPMPQHIAGQGLDPGDTWVFGYHDTSHGAGGGITTRVREHTAGRLAFDIVRNDSITSRWMEFTGAELTWTAVDATHTEVRIELDYVRGLDPSWYFGPLQDGLTTAGAGHFLDMMRLS